MVGWKLLRLGRDHGRTARKVDKMFEAPVFTSWELFFAGLGALSLWVKLSHEKRKAYGWSALLDMVVINEKWRVPLEVLIFVSIGAIVSSAVVHPNNAAQAMAAGVGWTGFLTAPRSGKLQNAADTQ